MQKRGGWAGRERARAYVCVCVVYVDMGESGREAHKDIVIYTTKYEYAPKREK